jgi:hypothetical protein
VRATCLPVGLGNGAPSWLLFSTGFGPPSGGGFGQGQGGGFGPSPGTPNPYANPPGMMGPPPKPSYWWAWLLGGLGVAGLVVCGCCGGFFMFSMSQVTRVMREEVEGHPAIAEHIGEIQSMSTNVIATGEETEKRGGGKSVLVVDVKGSKGSGKLLGEQSPAPQQGNFFDRIDLRLPSGEEISIK